MKIDVYADLEHLLMLNFSAPAESLAPLVPPPLRLHTLRGRGFPSIVLPRIRRLRPVRIGWPRVDYELFGLRILVEYDSSTLGPTKGIWFAHLIMDPPAARVAGNLVSDFDFEAGRIEKRIEVDGRWAVDVRDGDEASVVRVRARPGEGLPETLPDDSVFRSADEALATYNDIAYGFLPMPDGRVHVLQIADLHPDYVAWPLTDLDVEEVRVRSLHGDDRIAGAGLRREPCYFVGFLPRWWRWLPTERP